MKYIISRTSSSYEQPCEEAKKEKVPYWHLRTVSEKEFNDRFAKNEGKWKSKGKNHTTYDNGIKRQEEDIEAWVIEIPTLEKLHSFSAKYGDLIISHEDSRYTMPTIEIYDDYRE